MLRRYHNRHKPKEPVKEVKKPEVNFNDLTVPELKELAKDRNIIGYSNMVKAELIEALEGD